MRRASAEKYLSAQPGPAARGGLTLHRGGRARRTLSPDEQAALDRRMHGAFVGVFDEQGRVPSEGIQDVRQKKQHPWRVIGKRLVECGRQEQALRIVDELRAWVIDYYTTQPPKAA